MKKFLTIISAAMFIFFVAAPFTAVALPANASAAAACEKSFLGVPPWYRGLTNDDCTIKSPTAVGGVGTFIWIIVLNLISMAVVMSAYIAVYFILYGGFLLITGGSNPAQVEKGKKSIYNAVIGLVIAIGAIAITNLIFNLIGGIVPDENGIVRLSGEALLRNALNLAYFIAGTVSVIVIIIAGIFYALSGGDAGKITKAKNMLTYAIIGLIIILSAFAITNFVIGRFSL